MPLVYQRSRKLEVGRISCWNMEFENSEASWKTLTADSCNEQVSLEHSGALRDALEKVW